MEHTYTKQLFVIFENSNLPKCPVFLFAKPGNPIKDLCFTRHLGSQH